jgi:hypothetical protein
MTEENYELWYLLEHEPIVFKVSISPTKDVYDLKELIRQLHGQALQQYSAGYLIIMKVRHIRNQ